MARISYVNPSLCHFPTLDKAWSLPSESVIYALLTVKSLKETIKLSDQNIWGNADAEQVLLNGW